MSALGFIGLGRLGQTLALAFDAAGLPVRAVYNRRAAVAAGLVDRLRAAVAVESAQAVLEACDTVWITVSDDAIATLCASLEWSPHHRVVHCSGATELSALAAASQAGAAVAGFHPLHTFGDVAVALQGLSGAAVAVEAPDPAWRSDLVRWAQTLGLEPFALPPGARALYHASAHYAGSLVVTLMEEAVQLWGHFGVPRDQALRALIPLLASTQRTVASQGLAPGMAGVVARGDVGTLNRHLEALAQVSPRVLQRYADLSGRSVDLAEAGGRIAPAQALALRAALAAVAPSVTADAWPSPSPWPPQD